MTTEVYVYADWLGRQGPVLTGVLSHDRVRNRDAFRYEYTREWLQHPSSRELDSDLALYPGAHHAGNDTNFRGFLDSCPDRWGRKLMDRREAILARQQERSRRNLTEVDYLLGVHDTHRMGALRFKLDMEGPFLDDQSELAAPPISELEELERASWRVQDPNADNDDAMARWLGMLMAPGSSLGGARPKASVTDDGVLWMAKFPGRGDDYDVAGWECLTQSLAIRAGIDMAPCRLLPLGETYRTFLTKRFDRVLGGRVHFTSAMTQLGYYDGEAEGASYLEIAEFLTRQGARPKVDLEQLWRRILFSVLVSNTDDHLRNHGFLLTREGWVLSPAYDINPSEDAGPGLSLAIDEVDNSRDTDLVLSVAAHFQLRKPRATEIMQEVTSVIATWRDEAKRLSLPAAERSRMERAFQLAGK